MSSHEPIPVDGDKHRLLLSGLPPAETQRWSCRRKAAVVVAIRAWVLSPQEACEGYMLCLEEPLAWEAALDRNGIPGLRVTRCKFTAARRSEKTLRFPAGQGNSGKKPHSSRSQSKIIQTIQILTTSRKRPTDALAGKS